jgi:Protein of unknown function (DUF1580)
MMTIDIETETLIDLRAAATLPVFRNRTGKSAHISSVYRFVMRGARAANGQRIRLETVRVPSGLRTSREAVQRFIAELTDPDHPIPAPRTAARKRQIAAAENELVEAGFQLQ